MEQKTPAMAWISSCRDAACSCGEAWRECLASHRSQKFTHVSSHRSVDRDVFLVLSAPAGRIEGPSKRGAKEKDAAGC